VRNAYRLELSGESLRTKPGGRSIGTGPGPRLGLKLPTGWTFGDAMSKPIGPGLQAICLGCADRHTGRIRTAAVEIAQELAKHPRDPSHARRTGRAWRLPREEQDMEIVDRYGAYGERSSPLGPHQYVSPGSDLFETYSGRRGYCRG
jgi:hypothetical protein